MTLTKYQSYEMTLLKKWWNDNPSTRPALTSDFISFVPAVTRHSLQRKGYLDERNRFTEKMMEYLNA